MPDENSTLVVLELSILSVQVDCTWDETDPTRKDLIARVLDPKEKIDDEDLRAYLASSSSDSEVETVEEKEPTLTSAFIFMFIELMFYIKLVYYQKY